MAQGHNCHDCTKARNENSRSRSGHWFKDCRIGITESHQAGKTSVPGTAVFLTAEPGTVPIRSLDVDHRGQLLAHLQALEQAGLPVHRIVPEFQPPLAASALVSLTLSPMSST